MKHRESRKPLTVVLKLGESLRLVFHDDSYQLISTGTSSIVDEDTHQPLLSILSLIVETAVKLRKDGHRVVIVSSGAIGVGLLRMEMDKRPKHLSTLQVSPVSALSRPRRTWLTGLAGVSGNRPMQAHQSMGRFVQPLQTTRRPDFTHSERHCGCKPECQTRPINMSDRIAEDAVSQCPKHVQRASRPGGHPHCQRERYPSGVGNQVRRQRYPLRHRRRHGPRRHAVPHDRRGLSLRQEPQNPPGRSGHRGRRGHLQHPGGW